RRKKAKDPIKLLISNVYQPNKQYGKLLRHINRHKPDLVFLVETDQAWKDGVQEVEKTYQHPVCQPLDNTYGMLLYSKLNVSGCEVRQLVEKDVPSVRAIIESPSGKKIRFYGLHPEPPSPTENPYSTERDAELLIVARECEKEKLPILVVGDLNDVAWSYTTDRFLRISGLKDPRKGRGIFSTFHAKNVLMRWPLDHIFCSQHFQLIKMRRLRGIGSDHFPVLIELSLET
ncbi:MAG: endonuclease/exonuclease/phosphatase family protein, partial [Owenweeksia sp.]